MLSKFSVILFPRRRSTGKLNQSQRKKEKLNKPRRQQNRFVDQNVITWTLRLSQHRFLQLSGIFSLSEISDCTSSCNSSLHRSLTPGSPYLCFTCFKVRCSRRSACASGTAQKYIVRVDTKFELSLWWKNPLKSRPNFAHPLFAFHF